MMHSLIQSSVWQRYTTLIHEMPVKTKIASTFTINCIGDVTCQLVMHWRE